MKKQTWLIPDLHARVGLSYLDRVQPIPNGVNPWVELNDKLRSVETGSRRLRGSLLSGILGVSPNHSGQTHGCDFGRILHLTPNLRAQPSYYSNFVRAPHR